MKFKVVTFSCLLLVLILVTSSVEADHPTPKEDSKVVVGQESAYAKGFHQGFEIGYRGGYSWGGDFPGGGNGGGWGGYGGPGGGGGWGGYGGGQGRRGCRFGCCGPPIGPRGFCRRCCYSANEAYHYFQNGEPKP